MDTNPSQHQLRATAQQLPETPAPPPGRLHAPPLSSRIEVLWRIESGGEEENTAGQDAIHERWWGAVVQDCLSQPGGASVPTEHRDQRVHILLYDAFGEFEEDIARVVFLPDRTLIDLSRADDENQGVLDWRPEGDAEEQKRELSLRDVADEQEAMVMEAGISADADLEALRAYPANVQIGVTQGYRVFADGIKEMLGELVASKPKGYVVTEADVQTIFERIRRNKENEMREQTGL